MEWSAFACVTHTETSLFNATSLRPCLQVARRAGASSRPPPPSRSSCSTPVWGNGAGRTCAGLQASTACAAGTETSTAAFACAHMHLRVMNGIIQSWLPGHLRALQVGGLGLTLTAADRVIILDPAWNPSTGERCPSTMLEHGENMSCAHMLDLESRRSGLQLAGHQVTSSGAQLTQPRLSQHQQPLPSCSATVPACCLSCTLPCRQPERGPSVPHWADQGCGGVPPDFLWYRGGEGGQSGHCRSCIVASDSLHQLCTPCTDQPSS